MKIHDIIESNMIIVITIKEILMTMVYSMINENTMCQIHCHTLHSRIIHEHHFLPHYLSQHGH